MPGALDHSRDDVRPTGRRETTYTFGAFELGEESRELRHRGEPVSLEPKVFGLLAHLVRERHRVVSKSELLDALWTGVCVTESSLTRAVCAARHALGETAGHRSAIQTFYGQGYRFVAPVSRRLGVSRTAEPSQSLFVGRRAELGTLDEALESTLAGHGRLVLVRGEPGIGKTFTAERFRATARASGATVRTGRCREGEGAPAYWPWVQILRQEIDETPPESLHERVASTAPQIAKLVPELYTRLPDLSVPAELDPRQARLELFDAVRRGLLASAARGPLVLILDDLHRADHPTLHMLRFLACELGTAPLLVLSCYRPADLKRSDGSAALLHEIARESSAQTIELSGLSRDEIAEFIARSAECAAPDATVGALEEQTGGNPFFLSQVVTRLDSDGRLPDAREHSEAGAALSQDLREMITAGLDALPRECRQVLEVAAVIGRDFSLHALSLAVGIECEPLTEMLAPAIEAGAIGECDDAAFRFRHALVREVLYQGLRTPRRVRLHLCVGEALEQAYGPGVEDHVAELAHHFFEAAAAGVEAKAVDYARRAGRRASRQYAHEQAAVEYRRALEILELGGRAEAERCELMLALAEAKARAGEREGAREAFGRAAALARHIGAPSQLAKAALGMAPGFFAMEVGLYDPFHDDLLEEALRSIPPGDDPLRVQLLAKLAVAVLWSEHAPRSHQIVREAMAMAERLADDEALAAARHAWLIVRSAVEGPAWKLDAAARLRRHAKARGDSEGIFMAHSYRLTALMESGDVRSYEEGLAALVEKADAHGHLQAQWYALQFRAMRTLLGGRFEEVERMVERVLAIGQRLDDRNAFHAYGGTLTIIRSEQDRLAEFLPAIAEAADRYPYVWGWRACLAWAYERLGLREASLAEVERLQTDRVLYCFPKMDWSVGLALLAEAVAPQGDLTLCKEVYERLLPLRDQYVVAGICVGCWGSAARPLGMLSRALGRLDEAESHFEHALARDEAIGARLWTTHTRHELARLLLARGQPGDRTCARKLARAARAAADEIGMKALASEISASGCL